MFSSLIVLSLAALSVALPPSRPPPAAAWGSRSTASDGVGISPGLNAKYSIRTFGSWYTPELFPNLFQGRNYVQKLLSSARRDALGSGVSRHMNSLAHYYCGPTVALTMDRKLGAATADPEGRGLVCQQLLGILQQIGEAGSPTGESSELQFFAQTACSSSGALSPALMSDCRSLQASLDCIVKKRSGDTRALPRLFMYSRRT